MWTWKSPQDLCALRCPSNHNSPLTDSCASPVLAKCYSSIQLFTLSISSNVLLDQSSLQCQEGWGCSHFAPALWSSPGCPSQRQRVIKPMLILDLKSRGSVYFALIVPWCLLYQEGNTGEQLSKTQCLHRESLSHPNESGTRCRSSGLSAKVVWMLQKLVSYWFLWLTVLKGQIHCP